MASEKVHKVGTKLTVFKRGEFIADAAENGIQEGDQQCDAEHYTRKQQDHPISHGHMQGCQQPGQEQAQAQAQANKLLSDSLSDKVIDYQQVQKWDGKMPQYMLGNSVPFIKAL